MERLRHQLLAGARFAEHQHGGLGRRGLADQVEHRLQLRRFPDHALESELLSHPLAQALRLALEPPLLQRSLDDDQHRVHVERLGEVAFGAGAHRLDRGLDAGEGGHHHEDRLAALLLRLPQQCQPALLGHPHVRQHQGRRQLGQLPQPLLTVGRLGDLVTFLGQDGPQGGPSVLLVIDDEDALARHLAPILERRLQHQAAFDDTLPSDRVAGLC